MTRLRITKINESQLLTCLKYSLWGSKTARFKNWQKGDYLVFIVDKRLTGLATVVGKPFQSNEKIWDKDVYPNRIQIKFLYILSEEHRIPILRDVKNVLTSAWGPKYGWGILNQQVLTDKHANIIINTIRSEPNNLSNFESNIELFLEESKDKEEIVSSSVGRLK